MSTVRKDGNWAWLVSFGIFIAYLLETGLMKSLGVLLPDLREQFSTQTWIIGLAISSTSGFGAFACILTSGLGKVLSYRVIILLFGSFASLGVIIGSMATSVPMLALGLIVTGCFYGAQAVAVAAVPRYFDKYFDVANGFTHTGNAFGIIVMPLITQFLLNFYGWRGAMIILGGLTAHIAVCGALLRPVTQKRQKRYQSFSDNLEKSEDSSLLNSDHKPFHLHGSGNINNVNNNLASLENSDNSLKNTAKRKSYVAIFITTFDLHLFLKIDFVSLTCIDIATGYYYTGWLIYLVPHAEQLGFSPYASTTLAAFGGIGSLIGSSIIPLLTKVLSNKAIIILANVLASLSLAMDPILSALHTYIGLSVASITLNVGNALWNCIMCKELYHAVNEDEFLPALNWNNVGYSFGSLCSGLLSGWLYDKYGTYTASFLLLSIIPLLSLTPMILNKLRNMYYKMDTKYQKLGEIPPGTG